MRKNNLDITTEWIVEHRTKRNKVDVYQPYDYLIEKERTSFGDIATTGIVFLSNKECSFRCLMCDLWKNTTKESVPIGAIPKQIEWALKKMPDIKQVKLYNSGSFFDKKSIPPEDYEDIADLVKGFDSVIVEAHPKLIDEQCIAFNQLVNNKLEVAIGLETVHPEVLEKLNKKMKVDDFVRAVDYLTKHGIKTRAFILVKPPFMDEEEGIYWAKKSIDLAFDAGVDSCTVIPVRPGNGAMDLLVKSGDFVKPKLSSLEEVLDYGISLNKGRVFADTWDLIQFSDCNLCLDKRIARIDKMNLSQVWLEKISCDCL